MKCLALNRMRKSVMVGRETSNNRPKNWQRLRKCLHYYEESNFYSIDPWAQYYTNILSNFPTAFRTKNRNGEKFPTISVFLSEIRQKVIFYSALVLLLLQKTCSFNVLNPYTIVYVFVAQSKGLQLKYHNYSPILFTFQRNCLTEKRLQSLMVRHQNIPEK